MLLSHALRGVIKEGYNAASLRKDIVSGITVGVVAIPLGMALAIAIGVPPQHGLYTVIVAGFLVALFGGSRFNITGPTAAFVVILLPIVQQYGFGGLMLATMMSGVILIIMGMLKLGRVISFVPYPVTIGFTAGIGFVIAFLQLKDLLGLQLASSPLHFFDKVQVYASALPTLNPLDAIVGIITLLTFIGWSKFTSKVPAHIVALTVATLLAGAMTVSGLGATSTLGSQFHFTLDGVVGNGIPQQLPSFSFPVISMDLIYQLLPASLAIAMLGAIESLLCAVVADGMTKTRHDSNGELVAQGMGNIVAPLFGGIPATAAIARTATNIRAGGLTPVAGMVHAIFVLLAMLILAPVLSYIPMAGLAGILVMVAWNMSEAPHFIKLVKVAPKRDVAVLLTCFTLTVVFDMVVAVGVGMTLACLLFIQRSMDITSSSSEVINRDEMAKNALVYHRLEGPLFFAANDKIKSLAQQTPINSQVVVIDFEQVTAIDISAIKALEELIEELSNMRILITHVKPHLFTKLLKVGVNNIANVEICESDSQFDDHLFSLGQKNSD